MDEMNIGSRFEDWLEEEGILTEVNKAAAARFLGVGARLGWECPRCRVINSPWSYRCICKPDEMAFTVTTPYPKDDGEGHLEPKSP